MANDKYGVDQDQRKKEQNNNQQQGGNQSIPTAVDTCTSLQCDTVTQKSIAERVDG
jgi:hypothetical protein